MGTNGKSEALELVARCEAVGWQVSKSASGHWKVDTRKGIFTIPSTPSSARSMANTLADAKRRGLEVLEAKLGKRIDVDRQRRLDADRAENDAKLARMEQKVREFSRTGSVNVELRQLKNDPTVDVGLGLVNGIAIVAVAPAMLKTPIMGAARPLRDAEELLLADETIVYRCRKKGPWSKDDDSTPADQICPSTFSTPGSLRSHIGFHTMRTLRDADHDRTDVRKTPESEVSAITNAASTAVRTAKPSTVTSVSATTQPSPTTVELKAQLTATLTKLVAGMDTIGSATIETRNALLKLIDLVKDLKTEVVVTEPDPELVAKAAQYDALAATLGSLFNPIK